MSAEPRTAFVIDALPVLGGGERVIFTALEAVPDAQLFTLVYNQPAFVGTPIAQRQVTTSFIDRLPFAHRRHRLFLPLMPFAIQRFDLSGFDRVVAFSYAVSHGAQAPQAQVHAYMYTPMRYAWTGLNLNGKPTRKNPLLALLMRAFRRWDVKAAARVQCFAAISQSVAQRVQFAYQRQAPVIYPPVDVERFKPARHREAFFITVTRLVAHKRVDLMVRAFSTLNLPLVIVGDGPELANLRQLAGPTIRFTGYLPDEQVAELLGRARGFICTTEEDFGIAIVEAQAAGCPVIAYQCGGALETVVDGVTGLFFKEQTPESLSDAVVRLNSMHLHTSDLVAHAQRFNKQRFKAEFQDFISARQAPPE